MKQNLLGQLLSNFCQHMIRKDVPARLKRSLHATQTCSLIVLARLNTPDSFLVLFIYVFFYKEMISSVKALVKLNTGVCVGVFVRAVPSALVFLSRQFIPPSIQQTEGG